ncbi:cutinase family protein [Candidatus Saccharibacteria bacterium]|nr:cutinase family protein [Candidatus Saccharibacteria bacterium]
MPKKFGQKMWWQNTKNKPRRKRIVRYIGLANMILMVNFLMPAMALMQNVEATSCPDVKLIFTRGSGEERWKDQNYLTFKQEMTDKLALTHLDYEFLDLNYPAISVASILTLFTTFVSGGEAYDFGASIRDGVEKLAQEVNNSACPNTKYVLAGYSQGAMVMSKALQFLDSNKIIYAATFGDPKLYLPEGAGAVPDACRGANLSNYRIYVPDCRAYSGMLGGYNPYQTANYIDKLGTWCNKADFFCSSYLSMRDHTSYVVDGLYADASKVIFDKITEAFKLENNYVSLHDTAILIDSTGSMSSLIDQYKTEALRLAEKTLASGGRVALYDYRDVADKYEPYQRCNFETCTLESFKAGLDEIAVDGGGDTPESLLSAGLHVMKELDWKYGSTKSVVVLTDANYHDPDLDGTTFTDVVNLSKSIDPVNFYFVVSDEVMEHYEDLAAATGGGVVSSTSDLSLLTDTIIARYDSLPRVEESSEDIEILPEILDSGFEWISDSSVRLSWATTGMRTMVALNDYVLGVTEENSIVLENLDFDTENIVTLIPLSDTRRGIGTDLNILSGGRGDFAVSASVPKVPNAGKR